MSCALKTCWRRSGHLRSARVQLSRPCSAEVGMGSRQQP